MKDVLTVATVRAVVGAIVMGALGALAMWNETDELKKIIIAGGTPLFTFFAWRLGLEGVYDAMRKPAAGGETAVRTEPPLG